MMEDWKEAYAESREQYRGRDSKHQPSNGRAPSVFAPEPLVLTIPIIYTAESAGRAVLRRATRRLELAATTDTPTPRKDRR